MKCRFCEYDWESRVQSPKACPRCKTRFDYQKPKFKLVDVRDLLDEVKKNE